MPTEEKSPKLSLAPEGRLLARQGWLSRQPDDFQHAIFGIIIWREVSTGTSIIIAGDLDGGLWGVESGQVDITSGLSTPDSPPAHVGHPGSWWGPATLLDRPRNASVTARTPAVLALVPLTAMKALLDANPGWWRSVADLTMDLVELVGSGLADLLIRDSRLRCIAVLLRISNCRYGPLMTSGEVTTPLAQDEFAAMANLSRGSVGEVLRSLEADGLISLGYRNVTLHDPSRLRAFLAN
jgi:CRP/FNR family transcriptional regulator, cyclic AMP receptor protein